MSNKSGYTLTRAWFDFAFNNYECKCTHTALFTWIVELNNRLGWKKQFGLPTAVTMEGLSIGNRGTYKNALEDLEQWGFIKIVQKAKNSYTSCLIEVCQFNNEQVTEQALHQAMNRHCTGIESSNASSTVPIAKQRNKETIKPINKEKCNTSLLDKIKDKAKKSFENTECEYSNDFKKVWLELLQEPNWKNKSQTAIDKSLKRLINFDEVFSIELVNAAISGGWKGVVFTDTDTKYQNYKNTGSLNFKNKSHANEERLEGLRNLSDRSIEFLKLFGDTDILPVENQNQISIDFETFWNEYDKKIGDPIKLQESWDNIPLSEQKAALSYIKKYKQAQPDKQYRKNPESFLANKSWNDEIILKNEKVDTRSNPTARTFGKL